LGCKIGLSNKEREVNTMTDFEKVLMNRDGMTKEEAKAERKRASEEFYNYINDGADYDDIEEMLDDYGLEMDYIFDLL
jgi:hypothetical protein